MERSKIRDVADQLTDSNTAAFAFQSFLFAKLVETFQYVGQKLLDAANFWSLMFFVEALGIAVCYYVIGFTANSISVVSAASMEHLPSAPDTPTSIYQPPTAKNIMRTFCVNRSVSLMQKTTLQVLSPPDSPPIPHNSSSSLAKTWPYRSSLFSTSQDVLPLRLPLDGN